MSSIDYIKKKVGSLYMELQPPPANIPSPLIAYDWFHFADSYIRSASMLESQLPQQWLPVLQLSGHAVECALKGCLTAANVPPPICHDLIELAKRGEQAGYQLSDPEIAFLVHLSHYYYRDLATGTKHKARYPSEEPSGGSVPKVGKFAASINSLLKQASTRIAPAYRSMFEAMLETFAHNSLVP